MNLINKANDFSLISKQVDLKYVLYFLLISDVKIYPEYNDGLVYSVFYKETIYSRFKLHKQEVIDDLLKKLEKEKLIVIVVQDDQDYISVGTYKDDKYKLYSIEEKQEDILLPLKNAITSYVKDSDGINKARARDCRARFRVLQDITIDNFKWFNMIEFYKVCYEGFLQEPAREFLGKEKGQLTSLTDTYNYVIACQMIIYYFMNSEKFGKAISIGTLIYKRDEVYLAMKGKSKAIISKSYIDDIQDEDEHF